MPGRVEKYLRQQLEDKGALLFPLIDAVDYDVREAVKTAKECEEGGADLILVGGSIGVQGRLLDETVSMIKEAVDLPVVLFPGNIGTVSAYADAIYFMYLMNSRSTYWTSGAQILGAPVVKTLGIEALPTAYVVVEPGQTVGWVGDANIVPQNRPQLTAACALAGEYKGARFVITDVGSGAPQHVPLSHVKMVSKTLSEDVFYVVAGGIKNPTQAGEIISAGADAIHVGSAIEGKKRVREKIRSFSKAVRQKGSKK